MLNLFYISLLGIQELAAAIGFASTLMFSPSVAIRLTVQAPRWWADASGATIDGSRWKWAGGNGFHGGRNRPGGAGGIAVSGATAFFAGRARRNVAPGSAFS
jgi:hypothetical protein